MSEWGVAGGVFGGTNGSGTLARGNYLAVSMNALMYFVQCFQAQSVGMNSTQWIP